MEKKVLTVAILLGAAADLNKVLDLSPKISTEFSSTAKGEALKAAEKKFEEQLEKDLVEAAGLINPTDVLESETIDALLALGVADIQKRMKVSGGTASGAPKKNAPKKEPPKKNAPKKEPTKKEPTKKEPTKKEPTKKEPTKKNVGKKELSRYGHRIGSQAAQLDEILFRGSMVDQAAVDLGVAKSRVKSHISYLRKKGVKIVKNEKTGVWIVVK